MLRASPTPTEYTWTSRPSSPSCMAAAGRRPGPPPRHHPSRTFRWRPSLQTQTPPLMSPSQSLQRTLSCRYRLPPAGEPASLCRALGQLSRACFLPKQVQQESLEPEEPSPRPTAVKIQTDQQKISIPPSCPDAVANAPAGASPPVKDKLKAANAGAYAR